MSLSFDVIALKHQLKHIKGYTMSHVEMSKAEVLGLVKGALELNDEHIKLFSEFVRGFNKADSSSKEVFMLCNELYKKYDKQAVTLHLGRLFNALSNDNNAIIKRLKVISGLSKSAIDLKVILKFEDSFFYNIEASIKLFEALTKVGKEEAIKECRKQLFGLYSDKESMAIYNNRVADKIKELRKTYGVVDIDGVTIVSNLKKQASKLSKEEKQDLIAFLTASLAE